MRRFYLQNSIGERVDLNVAPYILTDPEGLGFGFSDTMSHIGDGMFKRTYRDYSVNKIVFNLNIVSDPYENYRTLSNFLNKGYELMFVYAPTETSGEYFCDVDVEYINKGEITDGNILQLPCSLCCRSLWYKEIVKVMDIFPTSSTGQSRFDLKYDFTFIPDSVDGACQIKAGGHIPSGLKIVVDGILHNPVISLTSADGTLIGKMELNKTIASGETLVLSSTYQDSGCWIDGVSQLNLLDITHNNFFRVPLNETCTLAISSDQADDINAQIYIYDYYRSI